jgi:hypothetical protein
MLDLSPTSRQPHRDPWSLERLLHERAIAMGMALEPGSRSSYSSALNSYITFCRSHNLPIEPSVDTFSFYIVFTCTFIKADSVDSYLSGICNCLEADFPTVRVIR